MRLLTALMALTISLSVHAESLQKAEQKSLEAAHIFQSFMIRDEQAIPTSLLKHAQCITVIPNMLRAGFVIGARTGWGLTSCRTANGWSPAAFHQLSGLNIGFQFGAEKLDVVLVFMHPDAVTSLSGDRLRLGGSLGVAVGPVGRKLEAGTDFRLDAPVYSYARAKGLYLGAVIEGSVMDPKEGYNNLVYGDMSTREILTDTHMIGVRAIQPYVRALKKYAP